MPVEALLGADLAGSTGRSVGARPAQADAYGVIWIDSRSVAHFGSAGDLRTSAHVARGFPAHHASSGSGAGCGARASARRHELDYRPRARGSRGGVPAGPLRCVASTDSGLVRCIVPPGSVARCESRVGDNHHHVVCRSGGAIVDVDCAVGDAPCMTAADDHGYAIDETEVVYWGLCPGCSTARSAQ